MKGWTALGVFVAVTIVAIAIWYKTSTKFSIVDLQFGSDGSLKIIAPATNAKLTKFNGRRMIVYTKSLGRLYGSVCSIGPSNTIAPVATITIISSAGAYNGNGIYAPNSSDYVLISSA